MSRHNTRNGRRPVLRLPVGSPIAAHAAPLPARPAAPAGTPALPAALPASPGRRRTEEAGATNIYQAAQGGSSCLVTQAD